MSHRLAALAALVAAFGLAVACGVGSPWFKTDAQYWREIREKYLSENPDTTEDVKQAISDGRIIMGMTEPEVVASIGRPYTINRSTYSWGTTAQFCYENPALYPIKPKYTYVYFENGRVTSWSQ